MPGDRKIIPFTSSRPLTLAQQFRRAAKGLEAAPDEPRSRACSGRS
jgi:hypothetical protein